MNSLNSYSNEVKTYECQKCSKVLESDQAYSDHVQSSSCMSSKPIVIQPDAAYLIPSHQHFTRRKSRSYILASSNATENKLKDKLQTCKICADQYLLKDKNKHNTGVFYTCYACNRRFCIYRDFEKHIVQHDAPTGAKGPSDKSSTKIKIVPSSSTSAASETESDLLDHSYCVKTEQPLLRENNASSIKLQIGKKLVPPTETLKSVKLSVVDCDVPVDAENLVVHEHNSKEQDPWTTLQYTIDGQKYIKIIRNDSNNQAKDTEVDFSKALTLDEKIYPVRCGSCDEICSTHDSFIKHSKKHLENDSLEKQSNMTDIICGSSNENPKPIATSEAAGKGMLFSGNSSKSESNLSTEQSNLKPIMEMKRLKYTKKSQDPCELEKKGLVTVNDRTKISRNIYDKLTSLQAWITSVLDKDPEFLTNLFPGEEPSSDELVDWIKKVLEIKEIYVVSSRDIDDCTAEADHDHNYPTPYEVSEEINCPLCDKKFSTVAQLKYHKQVYDHKLKHKYHACQFCDFKSLLRAEFLIHMKKKHDEKYQCKSCLRSFPSEQSIAAHKRKKHKNWHSCPRCEKQIATMALLHYHLLNHLRGDGDDKREFECKACKKTIISQANYDFHMEKIHNTKKELKCDICDSNFKAPLTLYKHTYLMHSGNVPRPFKCSECKKSFLSNNILQRHIREIHTNERLICDICGKLFKNKHTLRGHVQEVHEGKKKKHSGRERLCNHCGKTFNSSSFHKHLATHGDEGDDEYTYICKFCKHKFNWKQSLRDHLRKQHDVILTSHADFIEYRNLESGAPFICNHPGCGRNLTTKRNLLRHKATVHKESRTRDYQCRYCSKFFMYQKHATKHEQDVHLNGGTTCKMCDKTFSSIQSYERHMMIHTGQKPYTCKFCGRQFRHKNALGLHEATHGKEKKFVCQFCAKPFFTKPSLNAHYKGTHNYTAKSTYNVNVRNNPELEASGESYLADIIEYSQYAENQDQQQYPNEQASTVQFEMMF